jgi:glutamyl-Q tRNA(Asp) synthetase
MPRPSPLIPALPGQPARPGYVGRFAPSPSGPLHIGSLVTATASFLEARKAGGQWLLRIEDLDPARSSAAFTNAILATLEALGFEWDGTPWRQSQRSAAYAEALERLCAGGRLFACSCTRRARAAADSDGDCVGDCRARGLPPLAGPPHSLRLKRSPEDSVGFEDLLPLPAAVAQPEGAREPVLQRGDGVYAYQLAVVVDDAAQGVTDIVRGSDLRASTAAQRVLQQALGFPGPRYAHLPLVTEPDGSKLSKSARALPLCAAGSGVELWEALRLLRQEPPDALRAASIPELWSWAGAAWDLRRLRGVPSLSQGG